MLGSKAFLEKNKQSLNSFNNEEASRFWSPDQKYDLELVETLKRSKTDLEQGILARFNALRQRQLEQAIAQNCYSKKSYTYLEAEMCEKFHYDNDYKSNQIKSFWEDHISKHLRGYGTCEDGAKQMQDATVLEKETYFADCHNAWIRDFKDQKHFELEVRARELLGKNLQ